MLGYFSRAVVGLGLIAALAGCEERNNDLVNPVTYSKPAPGLVPQVPPLKSDTIKGNFRIKSSDDDLVDLIGNAPDNVIDSDLTIQREGDELPVYQLVTPLNKRVSDNVRETVKASFERALPLYFGENWRDLLSSPLVNLPVRIHFKGYEGCNSLHANTTGPTSEACVLLDSADSPDPNSGVIHEAISHSIFDRLVLGGLPPSFSEGLALLGSGQSAKEDGERTFTFPYYDFAASSTDGLTHNIGESSIQLWYTLATQHGLDFPALPLVSERIIEESDRLGYRIPFPLMVSILEEVSFDIMGERCDLEEVLRNNGIDASYLYPLEGEAAYYVLRHAHIDSGREELSLALGHVLHDSLYSLFDIYMEQSGDSIKLNSRPLVGLIEPGDLRQARLRLPEGVVYGSTADITVAILDVNEDQIYDESGNPLIIQRRLEVPVKSPDLEFRSVYNYVDGNRLYGFICNLGGITSSGAYLTGTISSPQGQHITVDAPLDDLNPRDCTTVDLAEMVEPSELSVNICINASDYSSGNNCQNHPNYQMRH